MLNEKSCSIPQEVVSIITHQGRSYIEKILSAITEVGFDLRAVPSVFMGGGAAVLKHRVTAQDRLWRPIYLTDVMPTLPGMRGLCGGDEDAVSYPVFLFRPNLNNPKYHRAWEILYSVSEGQKNQYLSGEWVKRGQAESIYWQILLWARVMNYW